MNHRVFAFFAVLAISVSSAFVSAQVSVKQNLSDKELWNDAMYYLKIGRMNYGAAYMQAYINRKVDPVKTLVFSEKDPRSVQILIKLQNHPKLGKLAKEILVEIDKGWQKRRKDVNRIKKEIERLAGTPRAQFHATQRLKEAGEYAIPVILDYLGDSSKKALYAKLIDTIVAIGPEGIEPVVASLSMLNEDQLLSVIEALGRMDYAQALPYLKELRENPKMSDAVRQASERAIESICSRNPKYRNDNDAAESFYQLALRYYYRDSAVKPGAKAPRLVGLAPDVRSEKPNIWLIKGKKLVPVPTPWKIYYELMTMRLTRRSLVLDNKVGHRDALALWLMANCLRQHKLSASVTDPIHPNDFPDEQYFYCCAGTQYALESLARAMADDNITIMIASLKALRKVASGNDILAPVEKFQPIVDALTGKNKQIQRYAALAIGWSVPTDRFPSDDEVVSKLAGIIAKPKVGGFTSAQVLLATRALEKLANAKLEQYKVDDGSIIKVLASSGQKAGWNIALECAKVLSLLQSEQAQKSLADIALKNSQSDQKVQLLDLLTESLRTIGRKLTDKQIAQLQKLAITESNPTIRKSATRVLGAANLEPTIAKKVLLAKEEF